MKIEEAFGIALKHLRQDRKLSQEKLAEICGLHRTYISLLERGMKSPSLATIFRLADALRLEPHQLVLLAEQQVREYPK